MGTGRGIGRCGGTGIAALGMAGRTGTGCGTAATRGTSGGGIGGASRGGGPSLCAAASDSAAAAAAAAVLDRVPSGSGSLRPRCDDDALRSLDRDLSARATNSSTLLRPLRPRGGGGACSK